MEKFNYQTLKSMQGEKLTLKNSDDTQVELTVDEISTTQAHDDKREAFSVLLSGDKETPLAQGTYQINHQSFGEVSLFMSPNSETEYEIIINRELQE
ncbi:DUF6916 family protein [Aliikangiella coralliicola]|uniref:DUF6916 domain-containing protein n=1 Tax=Aliikangiella coralliicola TaxID=2592383 RepID=A0A545U795_9GAMM|nr:hypothetical protein [Aliikangiella coralliicola]TQV85342.1 hypothetical protein FLL46_19440 [Aliikangiella coralliicola]